MFFSCAKPTSFGQNFERKEIQMHVGDQKVTLVKTHPQFVFVIVTLQSCAVLSPSSHALFPTRELAEMGDLLSCYLWFM